ncbi:HAD-IA family hydrolase [Candidatus Bathyarchaeota archaeon]|nr:HAD-IA family hydrolase [Candidatus Bathyarchaeota archaeon]
MKAVIFDLDGTLINSAIPFKKMKRLIIKYLEDAGVTHGLLNDEMLNSEITSIAAENLKVRGFPERYIKRVLSGVSDLMNRVEIESLDAASLIDGVPEVLRSLKERGFRIGLLTRSCREYAEKILRRFNIREYFDAILARDDVEYPKPNPAHALELLKLLNVSARDTVFIGDHLSDLECAVKSGMKFILFRRGSRTEDVDVLKIRDIRNVLKILCE